MVSYRQYVVDERLRYFKPDGAAPSAPFAREVRDGLAGPEKRIDPRFLYDRRGSGLFERICGLDEYYLTRAETSILEAAAQEIAGIVGDGTRLVELGSGASVKTRILLDALGGSTEYVPVDVSDILEESSELLLRDYPGLRITGILDTYEGGLGLLGELGGGRSLLAFLGSSYGNFEPERGMRFLGDVRGAMAPGDHFLVGLDLVKDAGRLEAAYDDREGVTAEFNLNLLHRMNAELGADFDPSKFAHRAIYHGAEQRIGMYLVSESAQSVSVPGAGLRVDLAEGESIRTEYSHKFLPGQITAMLREAGLEEARSWTDPDGLFSLTLARRPGRT
ncbi:MAG: L-histidine N(alpha)-methyltransferase [Nitrosopumilus sp.]|nr:L-histidine N(alpha)-methyltransferase [Nitrosopumilus sp.]CAI9831479.1 Histidine N-alpha-methyltransferase [Nitrosopumilaceae archaeon]MDA7940763.1 L-histidine N(alpha)-methyltransferase [Nitrosopumilus sp.]MDA7942971.1 L-histidine N(alpha)-methyltransferase [Nitrosopumilus sp.]MDA7944618.1 L-histidine N(alpha)-methyltransferase [Nitrosopumilus sp.]